MYLFFDTETTDLPKWSSPNSSPEQPSIVQLAAVLTDAGNLPLQTLSLTLNIGETHMSPYAEKVHGISKELANFVGLPQTLALDLFLSMASKASTLIAHNISFDQRLLTIAAIKVGGDYPTKLSESLASLKKVCTMKDSTSYCNLPGKYGKPKWPRLEELHRKLFNEPIQNAHDALADVKATRRCYFRLRKLEVL